jgi:amidohydrolase
MSICGLAEKYQDYAVGIRREFHMNPEVGMKEFQTQKRVFEELEKMGIAYEPIAGTGVVGIIQGNHPGKTVALRADMDALEIQEENDVAYQSLNEGIMHACGHDGHMAGLLTAARILNEKRSEIKGTVKLIFQPGEEGGKGAIVAVKEGVMDTVDAILGIHLWNECQMGTVSVEPGPRMASASLFKIHVKGESGHGSMPHQGVDAAFVGASILVNLQAISSREIDPADPVVVSIGIFQSGKSFNIMPGEAYLEGTTRCFSMKVNDGIEDRIRRIAQSTAMAHRAEAILDYRQLVLPTTNDPELSQIAQGAVISLLGEEGNVTFDKTMAGEDFSIYSQYAPAVFAFVGTQNKDKIDYYPHHHPKFDIDEDALKISAGLYAQFAVDFLNQ